MDNQLNSSILSQLNTKDAKLLHDLTDKLTSCGVGKFVNLPQIVVVGEQSVGKSSVLEAISHVRFPVKANVCTRVATELVLRRAPVSRINVSVRFDDKSKPPKTFQQTNFSQDDLPIIIDEAKSSMMPEADRDFSKDILRLEIEDKDMYPLTLVDLPGIFHNETEGQSLVGRERVEQLVASYIEQKNSIILAVISGNVDLASHSILPMIRKYDPQGERTLGVITKPDLAPPGLSHEGTYLQLARNEEDSNRLKLGWHVLRNRAEDEAELEQRDAKEEVFFARTAWSSLPPSDRGIKALREKLSNLLYGHIRTKLPTIISDIETKLQQREAEHRRLGKARSEIADMRSFLIDIAEEFRRLARDGIDGRYNDPFFRKADSGQRKLRAELRNFNRALDCIMKIKGSSRRIIEEDDTDTSSEDDFPEYLQSFLERYPYDFPDPEDVTREKFNEEVQVEAASNQGRELPGMPNQGLIMHLFQEQAAPWESIARFHINRVTLVAKAFVDELFQHIIGPPENNATTEAILSTQVDEFFQKKEGLLEDKLAELLRPYQQGYALPLDSEFRRLETSRVVNHLLDKIQDMADAGDLENVTRQKLEDNLADLSGHGGSEFGTDKVIDMMENYYQLSRGTFTDNIITLGIESVLICDIPDILTPKSVNKMSEDELRMLAQESPVATARRDQLNHEIEALKSGLAQCRRYKQRQVTAVRATTQAAIAEADGASESSSAVRLAQQEAVPPLVPARTNSSMERIEVSQAAASVQLNGRVVSLPILQTPSGSGSGDEPPRWMTPTSSESDVPEHSGWSKSLFPGRKIAIPKSRRRPSRSPSVEDSLPPT
ncbi:Dynamin, GTPase domain protein [Metarhizium rileyi]|uniref:Dynamin, GTPase domain protein n=1 Tax=Metarhizium rileyi (strain RCEF 4871) TaxID=1649241 RepID=A0A166YLM6_METRR|nr:Dynamin, GTPase domain protein [Metarhizium rileyi RCEF 4871]